MGIKITQKQLIIINITLFVFSFAFVKFSNIFRMNNDLHWIYTIANLAHLILFPMTMVVATLLTFNSFYQNNEKAFYLFLSLLPIISFLILLFIKTIPSQN